MDADALRAIAANQHGLFTRAQAAACGFSGSSIRARLAARRWVRVVGPVLADAGVAVTPVLRDRAALLAVPDGVLIGPSAARMWGLDVGDERSYLGVSRHASRTVDGVTIRRTRLPRDDLAVMGALTVTTRPRTIVDCVLLLPAPVAADVFDQAVRRQWFTNEELAGRLPGLVGRRGVRKLVRLMGRAAGRVEAISVHQTTR